MKILNVQKNNNCQKVKLFGIPVCYSKIKLNNKKKLKLLGGIFSVKESKKYIRYNICGIPLFWIKKIKGSYIYYLLGIKIKTIVSNENPALKPKVVAPPIFKYPESKELTRISPISLARLLLKYDVISFDIFDTLIFRTFSTPSDLFYILGNKLQIADFKALRCAKEREARDKTDKPNREVNIFDIYEEISKSIKIDTGYAIAQELELEKKFCFANPYMKQVFDILQRNNKTIIATSDMYLPKKYMVELLNSCGYTGFDNVFVSCDCLCNKGNGNLQKYIVDNYYPHQKLVHIGDHFNNDVLMSRALGIDAVHYPNVNSLGRKYRPANMSLIVGSLYKGIINAYIHSGLQKHNKYWQHGFIYGGLLTLGYCQFIEKLTKELKIDKILFVTRDGDIIHKVYNKYFGSISNDLLLCSRTSLSSLTFEIYTEDYIIQNLRAVAELKQEKTIFVLKTLKLDILINCLEYKEVLNQIFDLTIYQYIKNEIYKNREKIQQSFSLFREGAYEYLQTLLQGHKNILIVDVGWRGTGIVHIRDFLKKEYSANYNIYGAVIGARNSDYANTLILNKFLIPYVFSAYQNKNIMSEHFQTNKNLTNNMLVEIMYSMSQPSLYQYSFDYGYSFKFCSPENSNYEINQSIQTGILDFCKIWKKHTNNQFEIQSSDAYIPILHMEKNYNYIKNLFANYEMSSLTVEKKRQKIGDRIK